MGLSSAAVTYILGNALALSEEFLDIQTIAECRFTQNTYVT